MPPLLRLLLPLTLGLLGAGVAAAAAAGDLRPHGVGVAVSVLALGVPFAFLARGLWRWTGATRTFWPYVFVGALLLRLPLLFTTPSLSDDAYRYAWDGAQQRAGLNPYRHAPDAPEVAHLRDAIWENVNHKHVPTIYPPLAEVLFLAADLAHHSIRAQKCVFVAFDIALIVALAVLCDARGVPRARVVLYAWHPLPLLEIAGGGHNDSLPLFFLVLGLLLCERGHGGRALLALAASTLSKFVGGVAAPLVALRTPRKYWLLFPAAIVLGYLPYSAAGTHVFAGLRTFATHWEFNGGLFPAAAYLLRAAGVVDPRLPLKLTGFVIGTALLAWLAWKRADPVPGTLALIGCAMLMSPTVHPWYVLWCLPLLTCVPSRGLLCWTFTVTLAYHVMPAWASEEIWRESPWITALEYVPVFGLLALDIRAWRSGTRSPA